MNPVVAARLQDHLEVFASVMETLQDKDVLELMAERCCNAINDGKKILLCGNGGSAADCQHIAAEFVGRFQKERQSLPAIALTTDTSNLTAIGNDYGFEEIFSRQVSGLGDKGDVLIAYSTSGNSENVLRAIEVARTKGMHTLAFTGGTGGKMVSLCDVSFIVPSTVTARIQEMHLLGGHILCEMVESTL